MRIDRSQSSHLDHSPRRARSTAPARAAGVIATSEASEQFLDATAAAALPPDAVLDRLSSGGAGLSGTEAASRLARLGPNALSVRRVSALTILLRQLRNPLLLLLLSAAAVSGLTGDPTDAAIIAAIVALSVGLGFMNE